MYECSQADDRTLGIENGESVFCIFLFNRSFAPHLIAHRDTVLLPTGFDLNALK